MSKEFYWTPSEIRRLTLQELVCYLHKLHEYRKNVKPIDMLLAIIKKVLFAFLGVKDSEGSLDEQIPDGGLPKMKISKKALEAWEKEGRPNPKKFFANYKE